MGEYFYLTKVDIEEPKRTCISKSQWLTKSGKSGTIRKSSQASCVHKAHYAYYYVQKSSHFVSQNWRKEK